MKYEILEGSSADLSNKVNEYLQKGWSLHGNPYVLNNSHYQAVTLAAPAPVADKHFEPVDTSTKIKKG